MVFERSSTRLNLGLGSFFSALLLSQTVSALPTWRIARQNEPGILDDVVLFDAPAVLSDPPKVEMQAYVRFLAWPQRLPEILMISRFLSGNLTSASSQTVLGIYLAGSA
jgi:hypothetical protein